MFEFDQKLPQKDENVFHFVAYVPVNGRLLELDGLKNGPIDHGRERMALAFPSFYKCLTIFLGAPGHFSLLLLLDVMSLEGMHSVDKSSPGIPVLSVCHHIIKMKSHCFMEFSRFNSLPSLSQSPSPSDSFLLTYRRLSSYCRCCGSFLAICPIHCHFLSTPFKIMSL